MKVLFDEFEQAENVPGGRQSGTGLGLAISKRLARAMGGDIRADGELGKGATFVVGLKLAEAINGAVVDADAELHALSRPVRVALGDGHAPRVLIAEDNDINALLARRMCERFGCTVVVVKDGQDAVDAVVQSLATDPRGFDVILMDVFMPRMDGLEAARIIKDKYTNRKLPAFACPPIIALTANAFAEDRERCLAAGMEDYLAKPFDAAQLRALLARWLTPSVRRRAS
jgi:CheY-like chemotaxis protein